MQAREAIYEDLSTFITNFGVVESQIFVSIKVIYDYVR